MFKQFKLLESNAQLELKNGIHQNGGELFRDSTLSNYIQIAVAEVFEKVSDKSLFSLDIEQHTNTDELKSALSLSQFRFLQTFDLSKVDTVLDLSEDFGGVAHFLADSVGSVEAVKLDPDLARLSTLRCANKPNVCHISEDLDLLTFPPNHYDLIIIGQLEALRLTADQQTSLFTRLQASLSEKGVLVVNALNEQRLSKWLNASSAIGSDQLAYADLYRSSTLDEQAPLVEQSRKRLRDALRSSNFAAIDIHANFSTGKACKALFSENYLMANVNSLNHFYRLGSLGDSNISELLVYKKLVAEKQNLVDYATRFLLIAGQSSQHTRKLYDNDFSHFPGAGRKSHWRTITSRTRSAQTVSKTAAYPEQTADSKLVTQNLEPQPFCKGSTLIIEWLQAILDCQEDAFKELVNEYQEWLDNFAEQADFTTLAYDLLPFNLLLSPRGARSFEIIDTEWQINTDFSADFVLFRALFWFAFENKSLLKIYAEKNDIYSIGMFIVHYMPSVHQIDELAPFIELEESIQAEINSNFRANAVKNALLQNFSDTPEYIDAPLEMTAVWGDADGKMHEQNTQSANWRKESNRQKVEIALANYQPESPILRIDPMASAGAFELTSISISDSSGSVLWSSETEDQTTELIQTNGLLSSNGIFTALNDDPHLLVDLSAVQGIEKAALVCVEISWVWGQHYSATLNSLSQAVSTQNTAMVAQSHRLDQYRADIEYKAQRIDDLLGHRSDLERMVKTAEETVKQKQREINQLNARLHAQIERNDELHGYLLMRPTTRAKRVARRTLDRISGKATIVPLEPEQAQNEDVSDAEPSVLTMTGELLGQNTEDYALWVSENTLTEMEIEAAKAHIKTMPIKPVFSILVPIYNTDPEYLLPMIESVRKQIYPHWQLCLVDDCSPKSYLKRILEHEALQDERISIQLNEVNQGISVTTNDALAMATGDYIALLDHDDEISIDALYENAKVINQTPDVGLIYSDEDKMDMQGNRLEPYFKPDFSPDLLHTNNYICHFTVIKKTIVDEIGGFREGLDGSQDHDIILRAADAAEHVAHIPRILYHWRKIPGSTAVVYDAKSYAWEAGRKAVEDLLQNREEGVRVEFGSLKGTYRVFREIQGSPLISIVIPFKDKPDLLNNCLNSILSRSSYENFEIIGVSNNSEEALTFERMEHYTELDSRVRFVEKNTPFNFSEICNFGVEHANGEYVVLLNNDIEIISADWIERMLEHAQRPEVGAVGSKLLYPDGRIQHAGVVAGMVGAAGHPHKFFPDDHIGYHGRLHMVYNVSAVTGAMMMMRTDKFEEVGGLDEANLAVAYNDIDLCLKLLDKGYYNVFTPHAKATHHESISRGYEDTDEKMQRLLREQSYFLNKWSDFLAKGDPYYNPNLSLKNERFSLNFKD